jgi:hypothetical protein
MALNRQNSPGFFTNFNNNLNALGSTRESTTAPAAKSTASSPNSAPPKADAAPAANSNNVFVGLCGALNKYEQQLVNSGTVEIANRYSVQFIPPSLAAATIVLPGGIDKTKTPMQNNTTAKEIVNPETNSVNNKGLNRSVAQGTQIIQFIEMVMRNSSYITDQQTHIIDPVTGNAKPNNSTSKNNTTTWFKINVSATPIGNKLDTKRNDYAYNMVYTVTPYGINQAESQFFPQAQFRGVHKVYNYWFTGQNTQILNYEQEYSAMYFDVISGKAPVNNNNSALANQVAQPWQNSRVPTTASGQSDKGANKGANNPASTLADYLYSQADQSKIMLKIIGDPAWIQQGEVVGINGANFNFQGFYPDGTINTDAQQAVFAVNWNAPADYNNGGSGPASGTGLMDVNKAATGGSNSNLSTSQPQQSAAYTAVEMKSYFTRGRFEQELHGTLLTNLNQNQLNQAAANGRPAAPPLQEGTSRTPRVESDGSVSREDQLNPNKWDSVVNITPTSTTSTTEITNPPTAPAAPATAPASNGDITDADIVYQATLAASIQAGDITTAQAVQLGYKSQTMAPKDQ